MAEIWRRNKAFIGDVQSGLGFSQHCPASCHLNPARRLLQALAQQAPTEMNFNFCLIVRLNYQTRQCDMGVCGSTVHVQSGFEGHDDSGFWCVTGDCSSPGSDLQLIYLHQLPCPSLISPLQVRVLLS